MWCFLFFVWLGCIVDWYVIEVVVVVVGYFDVVVCVDVGDVDVCGLGFVGGVG